MGARLKNRLIVAFVALVAMGVGAAGWLALDRYHERYVATPGDGGGLPVDRIVSARLTGVGRLKVAELSGTVQSSASDTRGFGWLQSRQTVKMPYSVEYFIDVSHIAPGNVRWDSRARTLHVDAPDIIVAPPNIDEAGRTLIDTQGLIVTRKASEALALQVSRHAVAGATREAMAPHWVAEAREHGRTALARLLAAPLPALGLGDARVIVTYPNEREQGPREHWDVSRSVAEVLANAN